MADYQLTATDQFVQRTEDGAFIPNVEDNADWQVYQQWLADGGEPDPYVAPEPPEPQPDALAEAQRANARLDAGVEAAAISVTGFKTSGKRAVVVADVTDPVTQEQFDALQAQVDALQDAVTAMIEAQAQTGKIETSKVS